MKEYYKILGISEDAGQAEVKQAFRRLAFKYHPDTHDGDKRQAEEKFKEINEAYGVLGDETRRQDYDLFRRSPFAGVSPGTSYGGFQYSQQDIFRDFFSNRDVFNELSRMFGQAGLRFDQDFLNRVFFGGRGVVFEVFAGPGGIRRRVYDFGNGATGQNRTQAELASYKPNWFERLLSKIAAKASRFMLSRIFGLKFESSLDKVADQTVELEISTAEATAGCEKGVNFKRGDKTKNLMVKVPPGVKTGTRIRLRGVTGDGKTGDLYLKMKVRD
jgi:DnaJ-class molecular chaperone